MKRVLFSVLLTAAIATAFLLAGSMAHAQEVVGRPASLLKMYAGVNGIWFDNSARPSDFEAGLTGRASLSGHISAVGSIWYGFSHSYVRATMGPRITATDVNNQNFSVGFGAEYNACTEPILRPEEWSVTTSVGWKPYPETLPRWVVGAQGSYGLSSSEYFALAAVRYSLSY